MPEHAKMMARQRALADFGDLALRSRDLDEILNEACRIVSEALGTDLAKILEIEEGHDRFWVRAGVGWGRGIVGEKRLPMSERSSESYSIEMARPVISNDIHEETRFEFADFLKEHGAVALVNTPIFLPGGKAYGLLQVDSREPRSFGDEDVEFLRTYTTILGPVIDRLHKAHSLEQALAHNKRLLQELQHRVKNHIGIITAFVAIRAKQVASDEARTELVAIKDRIETLRLLHEQLYAVGAVDRLEIGGFMEALVGNLCHLHEAQSGVVEYDLSVDEVELAPELALPIGLILNEFVTNSLKHAFAGKGGTISVSLTEAEGSLRLLISDTGKGLPTEPAPARRGSGTGIKLIEGLAHQIGAEPVWSSAADGTELRLEFTASAERTTAVGG